MEFKNEYIIIVIIIIITIFFIINYDIYVLPKNELLCKPVYVTKKIINDKMIKKLNNPKESFPSSKNKIKQENEFNQVENELIKEENELNQVENKLIKEENMNHTNKIIRKKL